MSQPKISVIIQTYKRPENLQTQLEQIENQSIEPYEIIISHIKNDVTSEFDFQGYRKISYEHYKKPVGQMVAGTFVDPDVDYIALFDDDMIPGKKWFELCVDCMNYKEGIYGSAGAYYDESMERLYRGFWPYEDKENEIAKTDWVGGIWFVKQEHIHLPFKETPPMDIHSGSDDIWFGYQGWKHDIPRYVTPYGDNEEKWGIIDKPMAGMDEALHIGYDDHENDRTGIIKWMREQGWETIQDNHDIPYYIN